MSARFRAALAGLLLLFPAVSAARSANFVPSSGPAVPAVPNVAAVASDRAGVELVALGGQRVFTLPGPVTRVALGDPSLVDVKLLSDTQLRLVGLKAGNTDLTIWSRPKPQGETLHIAVGVNTAGLQTEFAKTPALQMARAVSDSAAVTLTGRVESLDAQQQALGLARGEAGAVNNQMAVSNQRMIAVEVRFAAISTSTMKALGLNFQKLGGGFQFASSAPNTLSNFQFSPSDGLSLTSSLPLSQAFNLLLASPGADLMGAISALNSANLAQILAEPTLLVRSGEDADFLAGGEIPIPVPQSGQTNGGITIQYRKFGVQLHVHATALANDRIVIRVNPEVSELDYQNALTLQGFNIPAITARSTDTTIEIGDGQSFVLAGLMYSESSSIEEKIPGIGNLPIIGDFFKRSQRSGQQQELVIIATPHLVSPMAPGTVPKLPGEGLSYAPSLGDTLLNTSQLDDFTVQYGLAKP
jgi:pilus assembly protein CpaC